VIDDGVPVGVAANVFLLKLPAVVPLTMPMAVMFASLMVVAMLSSNGELLAMRAAGIPLVRAAVPIIVMGFVVSLIAFAFYEGISPQTSQKALVLLRQHQEQRESEDDLSFRIPAEGPRLYWIEMSTFDPRARKGEGILVQKYSADGMLEQTFTSQLAKWEGESLVLTDAQQMTLTDRGQRTLKLASISIPIGRSAGELPELKLNLQDLSIAQLKRRLLDYNRLGPDFNSKRLEATQQIQSRLALPWCALGFALLGVSLGQRRLRTSAGVGFGVSLVVVFLYYLMFNTLTLMGARGALSPVLTAWAPNATLFAASILLLVWRKD
jgi:lipopolysaccharide export system permease protein